MVQGAVFAVQLQAAAIVELIGACMASVSNSRWYCDVDVLSTPDAFIILDVLLWALLAKAAVAIEIIVEAVHLLADLAVVVSELAVNPCALAGVYQHATDLSAVGDIADLVGWLD
jgi:hypothetical protein